MKKVLLYLWQLPQNLLGVLILLLRRKPVKSGVTFLHRFPHILVLGDYWLLGYYMDQEKYMYLVWMSEKSLYLGPLYLIYLCIMSCREG